MKQLAICFIFIFSAAAFAECGEGLQSFKKTLHPLLQARCVACHGDDGYVIEHSQSNAPAAYAISKQLVNFENIYTSTFMRKVRSAHWLNSDSNEMGMTEAEMDAALKAWWEGGEKLCPPDLTFQSSEVGIPQNLPVRSSGTYTSMQWDLGVIAPGFKSCILKVDIQRFSAENGSVPGAFRLSRPRISCDSGKTKIKTVRFSLNGITNSFENIYEDINTEISHDGSEKILSTELMIVIDQISEEKNLAVGFGSISKE